MIVTTPAIEQYGGKKLLYTVASRVANQNVKLESEHKESFYSLPLINNGGESYFRYDIDFIYH